MSARDGVRVLLVVAVALLLAGFAASAIHWTASEKTAFLATQEDYRAAISAAAAADEVAASAQAEAHWLRVNSAARLVEAHAHLLFLCILLILFAIVVAGTTRAGGRGIAFLGTAGILTYPAGLIVQAFGSLPAGQTLAAAGAVLLLAFAGLAVASLFRTRTSSQKPDGPDST